MANWEAMRLCPDLVIVPPHHDVYAKFSKALHEIYERYTDLVEPYGLDECWLDVTGNLKSPETIADEIRSAVKRELGITVSIGVSFNKIFAKLGSDLKKPDAVTVISRENFKRTVWGLPCSDMLFCGRATAERLRSLGIKTIGELAACPQERLVSVFGKNGLTLWRFANGRDDAPVDRAGERKQAKSVGHGITCVADLDNSEEANTVIVALTQDIGRKLRELGLQANGVQVTVRDNALEFESWQRQISPTQSSFVISRAAEELLAKRYRWKRKIRALTVSAINLEKTDAPAQLSLFVEREGDKREKAEAALDKINEKFGSEAIKPAVLLGKNKMPDGIPHAPPPGGGIKR